jgi:hypothetical protein
MPNVLRRARRVTPAVASLLVCCACSSQSGPTTVLSAPHGFFESGPVHVDEITDAGVPDLYNFSNHAVRLHSVRLVGVSRAVHVLSVRAYNIVHHSGP